MTFFEHMNPDFEDWPTTRFPGSVSYGSSHAVASCTELVVVVATDSYTRLVTAISHPLIPWK